MRSLPRSNAHVAVYETCDETERAVRKLLESGFDLNKLSIAGRGDHNGENIFGFYLAGGHVKYWGRLGPFWSGMWSLLSGWAFLMMPDIGPLLVVGPLADWIIAALHDAAIFEGLSPLGAGLYSIGIPKGSIWQYEAALKAGKLLLIAYGAADEVSKAREVLEITKLMNDARCKGAVIP